jgi:hypothetical protein
MNQDTKNTDNTNNTCSICMEMDHKSKYCFSYKTRYCTIYEKYGKCKNNEKCKFAHDVSELRKPQLLKCEGKVYDRNGLEHVVGCGGIHKFEGCKKRMCLICKYKGNETYRDHWTGEGNCLWCKYCKKYGHTIDICRKLDCKHCGQYGHSTKTCLNLNEN